MLKAGRFSLITLAFLFALFLMPFWGEPVFADNGFNVKEAGAKGDGKTDDTAAIQSALDQHDQVFIPDGTYLVNVDTTLLPKSNQTIVLSDNAILKAIPTSNPNYAVFNLEGINNSKISGGQIVGERDEHSGTSGEWGMGINIVKGSRQISISNIKLRDFWGDGVYLGGFPAVSDITVDKVICDNNRRLGLAVTNASHVTISNCVMKNSIGTPPAGGIDLEPNKNGIAEDILISNTECSGNYGSGIDVLGTAESISIKGIEIKDTVLKDNFGDGIRFLNASDITLNGITSTNNNFGIDVPRDVQNLTVINSTSTKNRFAGISIVSTKQKEGIENITFENSVISNNSQDQSNKYDGVRIDLYDGTGYIENIQFKSVQFIDNQTSPTQRYGVAIGSTIGVDAVSIDENCIFSGNISGDNNKENPDIFDTLNIKPFMRNLIDTIKSWLNLS
jgi:polygalacturonase